MTKGYSEEKYLVWGGGSMRHFLPLLLNRKFSPEKCVVQQVLGKKPFPAIASVVVKPPATEIVTFHNLCVSDVRTYYEM